MDMVGHQDVGMHAAAFAVGDLAKFGQVAHIVDFGKETRLAVIAALDDVLRYLGQVESWQARHGTDAVWIRCQLAVRWGLVSVRHCRNALAESAL